MNPHDIFNIQSSNRSICGVAQKAGAIYLASLQVEKSTGATQKMDEDRQRLMQLMDRLNLLIKVNRFKYLFTLIANLVVLACITFVFRDALSLMIGRYSSAIIIANFIFIALSCHFMLNVITRLINQEINLIIDKVGALGSEWIHIMQRVNVDWWQA